MSDIAKEGLIRTHQAWWDADQWSRLWKRAAKKHRRRWFALIDDLMEENAAATRRLELLRRVYADTTSHGHCPFCRMESTSYSFSKWAEREYKHADDCELAKELADAVGSEG